MKKIIPALLIVSFTLALISLGYTTNAQVAIGKRSDEVKVIQEILKTDPSIYPEGYVTGYFGKLTESAVKKLQKRCKLSETGEVDENTLKCIYPIGYKIQVLSPNGGETWSRNEIQVIKWKVEIPEVILKEKKPYPFWYKGSIDLFKREPLPGIPCPPAPEPCPEIAPRITFIKHLATVNLLDGAYSWRITPDIPNGNNYIVRISLGPGVGSVWYREKMKEPLPLAEEIWPLSPPPNYIYWDESDSVFKIIGEVATCPPCPEQPNLEKVIAILEKIIEELQKAIALLK